MKAIMETNAWDGYPIEWADGREVMLKVWFWDFCLDECIDDGGLTLYTEYRRMMGFKRKIANLTLDLFLEFIYIIIQYLY